MLYNGPFFRSNWYFAITWWPHLLILLIIQWSVISIFNVLISNIRFIDIISKSWHPLQTFGWNLNRLFRKIPIVKSIILFWIASLINRNAFRNVNSIIIYRSYVIQKLTFKVIHRNFFLRIYYSSNYFYLYQKLT